MINAECITKHHMIGFFLIHTLQGVAVTCIPFPCANSKDLWLRYTVPTVAPMQFLSST